MLGSLMTVLSKFDLGQEKLPKSFGCFWISVVNNVFILQLNALLTQLVARDRQRGMARPVLEEICMFGCQIKDENLETMNQYFPFLHCHRRWHPRLPSSTFV